MQKAKLLLLAAAALAAAPSWAQFTVATGNDNQNVGNVLAGDCGVAEAQGTTVFGCLSGTTSVTLTSIDTAGAEVLSYTGGQATLETVNTGDFSGFSVSLTDPGALLGKVVVNIDASANGFVQFSNGTESSGVLALGGNGVNYFTITGSPYDTLFARTFTDAAGTTESDLISSVQQLRMGAPSPIPEPETYAMMAGGLGMLAFMSRRRRQR